ncbi:B-cell receptor-associated protein 29-like isoform X1 [Gambusia affinis]|uniref:B-cell receptor-associated protein 29-like isoform X1 n=1 Tax=Gambusia affinis TaxID=33528 RepID=UPI001CDB78F6|nr:B-cell receptor-associated protein 29-like isoform X1 [Gambusia affinis]XP_043981994.1 B-cell receptor-associated protein 29-like isoform X1 [Gambusia affinis]
MTLQWTAVAFFLYAEIVFNLILCIPFISAHRWHLVFNWRIWSWLSPYWNKFFFAMIMALVVLFCDAIREVQKYSGPEPMHDAQANPNLYDHVHMKLFRAQRNLYICGFSLFLWLVMRRIVTLLNQIAETSVNTAGLQAQMENAFKTAEKHQEDNQILKTVRALLEREQSTLITNNQLKLEIEKLQSQLKAAEEAVRRSDAEVEAMKKQAKGLAHEYDRLLREHYQLQNLQSAEGKKDQ